MLKLFSTAALVAGLAFTSAAPASAFSWSSVTDYFTRSAPYAATRIDYEGPMRRPTTLGGINFSSYPQQTEDRIAWARANRKPIDYIQGRNGTITDVIINGIGYPGVRTYIVNGVVTTNPNYHPVSGVINNGDGTFSGLPGNDEH